MKASGLFKDWMDLWELPQYDYPISAKTFAEILKTVVRDALNDYKNSLMTIREIHDFSREAVTQDHEIEPSDEERE